MDIPSHRERRYMQHLRAGGWVKANLVPAGTRLIENLLAKGWIESAVSLPTRFFIDTRTSGSQLERVQF
jgi:hypothetical protein